MRRAADTPASMVHQVSSGCPGIQQGNLKDLLESLPLVKELINVLQRLSIKDLGGHLDGLLDILKGSHAFFEFKVFWSCLNDLEMR
jgi:hypothetical protein